MAGGEIGGLGRGRRLIAVPGAVTRVGAGVVRLVTAAHRAADGLALDAAGYGLAAGFAAWTAAASTLAPHRAWGGVAWIGYAAAALLALLQLAARARGGSVARMSLTVVVWVATALVPLILQAMQRAAGRTDRAQEEVLVIEDGGRRLLETATPYLDRADIAALPEAERLLGYFPYQPGMALFGLPRALDPAAAWWSDARVWFAIVTAAALAAALVRLRRAGVAPDRLVRALQVATVLPLCALTLATGGDDLPVLALALLALALAATGRPGLAGLAVGAAAALKLFAWPVALVLGVYAFTRGRATGFRFALAALLPPLMSALPALLAAPGAMVENVLAFPFGRGLVSSPAASPLPGHLIATSLPGGRTIAVGLVLLAGMGLAGWLWVRPPRTVAAVAAFCAYGLLTATLLLPATRFGYLLYPAALGVWSVAARPPPDAGGRPTGDPDR
jgi:hypothetical protein